jgi:hypothetical protein
MVSTEPNPSVQLRYRLVRASSIDERSAQVRIRLLLKEGVTFNS